MSKSSEGSASKIQIISMHNITWEYNTVTGVFDHEND